MGTLFAIQGAQVIDPQRTGGETFMLIPFAYIAVILLLGVGVIALDLRTRNKQITTISAVYFGLLLGFLFSHLFISAILPIVGSFSDAPRPSGDQLVVAISLASWKARSSTC